MGHNLFEFAWQRSKEDRFQSAVPRDPNFFQLGSGGDAVWAFEGAMKMCFFSGHDFYVLGRFDADTARFVPLDPERSMGSDPLDVGGYMFASQTFAGANGTVINSAWVLEGDCDWTQPHFPPQCPAMLKRGWLGVHSLPRVVSLEITPPVAPGRLPRHALVFAPLPALATLRTGVSAAIHEATTRRGAGGGLPLSPPFRSSHFQLDVSWSVSGAAAWDVGVQVLWSDQGEWTRVGMRSAAWMNNTRLVFVNDLQRNKSACRPPQIVHDPSDCQSLCATHGRHCIGWTFSGSSTAGSSCRLVCDLVPLLAVAGNTSCGWSSRSPVGSVSGMMPAPTGRARWAMLYMDRRNASATTHPSLLHPLGGLVRLLETEASARLSVFVDKSIVEAFAMGGRRVLTGRVYPSHPNASGVGVYAVGATANATAWEMGPAFAKQSAAESDAAEHT